METVELTADETALLAEYDRAARDVQAQAQGALRTIIRLRRLEGNWRLDGNKLVRAE